MCVYIMCIYIYKQDIYKKLYVYSLCEQMNTLQEMEKFLEMYNLPTLTQKKQTI